MGQELVNGIPPASVLGRLKGGTGEIAYLSKKSVQYPGLGASLESLHVTGHHLSAAVGYLVVHMGLLGHLPVC